jgi:plasmid maintenance system antidote protein VapI
MTFEKTRRPTAPGEIVAQLYLAPRTVSIATFAEAAGGGFEQR